MPCKPPLAQEVRTLLAGRRLLPGKRLDIELSLRGRLRSFGLKLGVIGKGRFDARVRDLVHGQPMLARVVEPVSGSAGQRAGEAGRREFHILHRAMLAIVHHDGVCRRLMTVPGAGALVALTFSAAVDDPARFARGRAVGAHFGLTPKRCQSGETDAAGSIAKIGDDADRTALDAAATVMLTRSSRFSSLKRWALDVARRRGVRRAKVALARKLSAVLLRIWTDGGAFRVGREAGRRMTETSRQGTLSGTSGQSSSRRGPVAGTRNRRGRA